MNTRILLKKLDCGDQMGRGGGGERWGVGGGEARGLSVGGE